MEVGFVALFPCSQGNEELLLRVKRYMEKHPEIERNRDIWGALQYISDKKIPCADVTEKLLDILVRELPQEIK